MPDFNYKQIKLHFSDKGKGKTIVFLHGFLEEIGMWNDISKVFEKTHRVICLDLLGHGKTGNLGYIHSMESQAEMLKYLLNELGIDTCTLIGHSMGGYVALAFAELYQDNVAALCLMNSTAKADDNEKKRNRDRAINAVKQNHKTFIRLAIPNLFAAENQAIFKETINDITRVSLQMSQQGIIASLEGMKVRSDRTHLLGQHYFPVLMIIGKRDPALNFSSLMEQSKHQHVQSVIFEDGHMSHIENQEELKTQFIKWISEKNL